jgi:hypothetical protein
MMVELRRRTMRAREVFHADVVSGEQRIRLIVSDGVDGWVAAVYYPDTKESITLCQEPDIELAKAVVQDWARIVHNITGVVEWVPGFVNES